jgi:transposase
MNISIIGLDIAKSVFQVHGEDGRGGIVVQKRLGRKGMVAFFSKLPPCIVALEACGTSHYWGRTLEAWGHEVRLIPAAYVKPFVKRNKTDARDAAAICVAAQREDMRPVAVKSEEQQASRALERLRELMMKQRTQVMNSLRAMLAEFGIVAAQGSRGFDELVQRLASGEGLPEALIEALRPLAACLTRLTPLIEASEEKIASVVKADAAMGRLTAIPGVGFITAHALVAAIGEGRQFRSARDFAAWAGLTPRESSSAGRRRMKGFESPGREPPAQTVRPRGDQSDAPRPRRLQPLNRLAAWRPCPAADEGRGHGPGGQDRPHRVGRARRGKGLLAPSKRSLTARRAEAKPVSSDQSRSKES